MVIDSNIMKSGKTGNADMIKLQRGDKIIERRRIDWEKNQSHFIARPIASLWNKAPL